MCDKKPDIEDYPVIFRKFEKSEGEEVIALFPTEPSDCQNWYLMTSYMHVGQHGGADYHRLVRITKPAKPEEYADLLAELTAIYGNSMGEGDPVITLKVYRKVHPWMNDRRQAEWRRLRDRVI